MAGARNEIAEATRKLLVGRFPNCFMPAGHDKLPLAIGIYHQIRDVCPDISSRHLHMALRDYTIGPKYLRQLIAGTARVNLNGDPYGAVTEHDAEYAVARLAALKNLWAAFAACKAVHEAKAAALEAVRAFDRHHHLAPDLKEPPEQWGASEPTPIPVKEAA